MLLLLTAPAHKGADSTPLKRYYLPEVVVTAHAEPTAEADALYPVKVFGPSDIRRKGATTLRELLQHNPQIDLRQRSVFGTAPEIQGMSKENVKILIDGVPVVGRLNGIIDLAQIDLADAAKVEVVKGPVSVFYGTDAAGGVINIIPRPVPTHGPEADAWAYYETPGAASAGMTGGWGRGGKGIRLSGGFYDFAGVRTSDDRLRSFDWEPRRRYWLTARMGWQHNGFQWTYSARRMYERLWDYGEPSAQGIIDKAYFTQRGRHVLAVRGEQNGRFLTAHAYALRFRRFHHTYRVDSLTGTRTRLASDPNEETYRAYGSLLQQAAAVPSAPQWRYMVGGEWRHETAEGRRIRNGRKTYATAAAFGHVTWQPGPHVAVQPAVRITFNSAYGTFASPAVNVRAVVGKGIVRASYGRGYRAPSLKELFLNFRISSGPVVYLIEGNPELRVERSHSVNLSYRREGFGGKMRFQAEAFYHRIRDLIGLSAVRRQDGVWYRRYLNISRYQAVGGDVGVEVMPSDALRFGLTAGLVARQDQLTAEHNPSEFLATPHVTALARWHLPADADLSADYRFTGPQRGYLRRRDGQIVAVVQAPYHHLDVSAGKQWKEWGAAVRVGVKNLFDVKNLTIATSAATAHSEAVQLWGRSFFVQLTWTPPFRHSNLEN